MLRAGTAPLLVIVTTPESLVSNDTDVASTSSVVTGGVVTVTCTVTVCVLLPLTLTVVGPSAAVDVSVMVQLFPDVNGTPQVVPATMMALPAGMVASMPKAGSAPLLVIVTTPEPLVSNTTGVVSIASVVAGGDTVTSTVIGGVLLPLKDTSVGPSAAVAVKVMVQLVCGANDALQVLEVIVNPLALGITGWTLMAAATPLFVIVTFADALGSSSKLSLEAVSEVGFAAAY